MPEREVAIVVYGATGYSGRLICGELLRSGARFAVAGRSAQKLEALRRELGLGDVPAIAAAIDDPPALKRMAARGRVVLSCAGPFALYGRPVQDAALAARSHYLDITGEHEYMLMTYRRDDEALQEQVALINGVGFDVVPTDAAAVLAAEPIARRGGEVDTVRLAFTSTGSLSHGTMRSVLERLRSEGHRGAAYVDGQWRDEPIGQHVWVAPLPPPFNGRSALSVPWGDVATAPRSTWARNVRVYLGVPPAVLPVIRVGTQALRMLSHSWARDLLQRGIDLLPAGPTPAQRARACSGVCAEAVGQDGERHTSFVTCGDGYDFTAVAAALCARLCAAEGFDKTGALTPTQAFGAGALLEGLREHGVAWGVDKY